MERRVELFAAIRFDWQRYQMPVRALARKYGVHRRTVREALASAVPPERKKPERASLVLEPVAGWIDEILREDLAAPRKQRHTVRRVYDRLADERGRAGVIRSAVTWRGAGPQIEAEARDGRAHLEGTVPQVHEPGAEAEVDFADVWVGWPGS